MHGRSILPRPLLTSLADIRASPARGQRRAGEELGKHGDSEEHRCLRDSIRNRAAFYPITQGRSSIHWASYSGDLLVTYTVTEVHGQADTMCG